MNDIIIPKIKVPKTITPGYIEIVDRSGKVLSKFENSLEAVAEDHKDLKPGNYLTIHNKCFDITMSCRYIKTWVEKRRKLLSKNLLKKDTIMKKLKKKSL